MPRPRRHPHSSTSSKTAAQRLDSVNNLKEQILKEIQRGNFTRAEQRLQFLRDNSQNRSDLLAKSLCDRFY